MLSSPDVCVLFVEATSGQKISLVVSGSLRSTESKNPFQGPPIAFWTILAGVPSARYPDENDGPPPLNLD